MTVDTNMDHLMDQILPYEHRQCYLILYKKGKKNSSRSKEILCLPPWDIEVYKGSAYGLKVTYFHIVAGNVCNVYINRFQRCWLPFENI